MPDTSGYADLDSFDHFRLVVKNSVPNEVTPPALAGNLTKTTLLAATIPLAPNTTYSFAITGYDGSNVARAFGVNTLAVTASAKTVSVTLKEIVDGDETGTFVAANTLVAGYDTALLNLSYLGPADSGSTVTGHNLKATNYNGALKSGYYLMTIALTKSGYQSVSIIDVVHIYGGFTSTYAGITGQAPLPTLRPNVYTITYNFGSVTPNGTIDGIAPTDPISTEQVNHGDTITQKTITTANPSYTFGNWFYSNTFQPGDLVTNTTKIIKGGTLYAKWEPTSVDVNFSGIDFEFTPPLTPQFSGTASYNKTDGSITFSLSITNASAFDSIEWYVENTTKAGIGGTFSISGGTVDNATNWYQAGDYTLTVIVYKDDIPYTGYGTVTCNP